MSAQFIEKDGQAAFAVVPIDDYNRLLQMAEDLDDVVAYDKAAANVESGNAEFLPGDFVERLVLGDENPLKVWREYRELTQGKLAERAGISQGQVALIEGGKRQGTVDVLKSLAEVLEVDLDDLVK